MRGLDDPGLVEVVRRAVRQVDVGMSSALDVGEGHAAVRRDE